MKTVAELLETLGLGRHLATFEDNGISEDLIHELTSDDLRELGLNLGDRKRFLRAVAEMPAPEAAVPPATDRAQAPGHAERRRLTVMFVDLVGSTALSGRLDPEELGEVIREYQDAVAGVASRFGGHVAQFLGDGVLCYFGWPRAIEDAAERAVGAGLQIVKAVGKLTACGEPLACRVGIATGLVVVGDLLGDGAGQEDAAIGDTPNFAARLQQFAGPGQVVIGESTRRLLGSACRVESLGRRSFKGIAGQQEVFAVHAADEMLDRFTARAGGRLMRMVGRDQELALLMERWRRSSAGEGQAVLLSGEAGIGKSRICRALVDRVDRERAVRVHMQCSPYHADTAFWPAIRSFAAAAGIADDMTAEAKLDRVEALLARSGNWGATERAVVAELLGIDGSGRYGPLDLAPSARRAASFAVMVGHVVGLSREGPVLVLVEDGHWCDPTTLELLANLADRIASERVMLLVTSRPEREPELPALPQVTRLTLNRLGRAGVEEIVARLSGGSLPAAMIDAIIERTDGVPLFVEELTKAMVESGELTVPASLHDTLMARLDRLPEVKEVAQIASVMGREFDSDPLAEIAALSHQRVIDALDSLRRVELVFRRGVDTGRYIFKHALVRDAAYESLLNRRRQEIHGRILDVLKSDETTAPGVLAHHAAEAGRHAEAVHHGRRAAEEALRRPAYAEALTHLQTALAVLDRMETTEETKRERIGLLLLAGQARIAAHGYAAPATVATYAEIEQTAREIGDRVLLVEGLYGRWAGQYVPGRNPMALGIADTICEVAARVDDTLPRALGHRLRGTVLTMMGRVAEATEALGRAREVYDPAEHRRQAARFGQDVGIAGDCYLTGVRTLAGQFDGADALGRKIIADLEATGHAHSSGYGLGHVAVFLCAADVQPLGQEVARACIDISARNRMPLWEALGRASLALSQVTGASEEEAGVAGEAVAEFGDALATLARLNFDVFRPMLLPGYALGLARAGRFAEAAAHLAEAADLVEEHAARFAEPEVHRVEGRVALMQGSRLKARACFEHALGRARDLGHRSWELRAAQDLAGLMREAGEGEAARRLLVEVYRGFTEGHSLPPLTRARRAIGESA